MTIPKSMFRFFIYYLAKQRLAFIGGFLCAAVWALNENFFPYFIKKIVNTTANFKGARSDIYPHIFWPITLLLGFWIAMSVANRIQGYLMAYAMPRLKASIRQDMFDYVREHSHHYFADNFAGSIANKISDLPSSAERILDVVIYNFIGIGMALAISIVFLWGVKPIFALAMLGWVIVHFGISQFYMKRGNALSEQHADANTLLSGKIVDSLSNITNVRLFAANSFEGDYFKPFQIDEIKKSQTAQFLQEKMRIWQGLASAVLTAAVMYLLVYGWVNAWVTLGDFTLVSMLVFGMLGMIWYVSFQLTMYVQERGKFKAALELVSRAHEVFDSPDAKPLIVSRGELEFKQVSFYYQRNKNIFDKQNLLIPAGQKIGLVGFSGSGKTTFVNLILRLYDINAGQILIDGQDIAKVTQDSLHQNIAMIPQDSSLFHRSLMENIRYGRLDATDEEVIAAAKQAHCDEFIHQLSEGYHTLVGERGIKLSGGQRQRIAIARAILKNAAILILDEATSALDSVTEILIQASLNQLMQNRTTIVIAHRLSTLANMDRILVFNQGEIVEDGSHQQLLANNGHFAELWQLQKDGFLPDSSAS
ncbi:MAG: ABC transporter ATP-binding protein [Gammaproteobacteria bacterium]|nr:ABC transporter ATP-binding protein [Gammaproteobacteria bacterium]